LALWLALDLAAPVSERGARLGESIERLDAAAAAHPQDAGLARVRGGALAAAGRPAEAEASFARAIVLDPDDIASYAALADALLAKRSVEQAVARAGELGLGPGATHQLVGAIYDARGDRVRALDAYGVALREQPASVPARISLAMVLAASDKAEQRAQALALAREAHAARPRDPFAAEALGLVLLRSGKAGEAVDPLRLALADWPPGSDAGEVRYHLALAYERTGQRTLAEAHARAAASSAAKRKPQPSWAGDARQLAARLAPKEKPATASPTASSDRAGASSLPSADMAPEAAGPAPPTESEPAPKAP
jgi:tetratricopeptide (TPR) repeat protein